MTHERRALVKVKLAPALNRSTGMRRKERSCRGSVYLGQGRGQYPRRKAEVLDMDPKVSALERAFQLARSGQAASIDDIKKRLKREGYEEKAVDGGPSVAGQLRKLIIEASERKRGPILSTIDSAPRSGERRSSRGS
jgi:hypothetical protein